MKRSIWLLIFASYVFTSCTPAPPSTTLPVPTQTSTTAPTLSAVDTPLANSSSGDTSITIPDPCTLLTDSEITAVLNKSVRQRKAIEDPFRLSDVPGMADRPEYSPLAFARRCEVTLADPSGGLANPQLVLTIIPGRTALDLDRAQKAKPSLRPVEKVGDLALWSADTLELEFMKGLTDVKLTVADESIGPATDEGRKLDQARSLAIRILARLP